MPRKKLPTSPGGMSKVEGTLAILVMGMWSQKMLVILEAPTAAQLTSVSFCNLQNTGCMDCGILDQGRGAKERS